MGSPRNTAILIVPILLVLITFLFWYQTWFGRALGDQEMANYLADTSVPHKTQHALAQLSDRMARGDPTAKRWYPQLLALGQNREPQIRLEAAWAMGQDNHSEEFHQALRKLTDDPAAMVRWNAALALVRFGDSAGEPQLCSMLQPFTLNAADSVLIPIKSGHFALDAVDKLFKYIEWMREVTNKTLEIEGILLTMLEPNTRVTDITLRELNAKYHQHLFKTSIPKNSAVSEASFYGKPAVLFNVNSRGAAAYLALAREIIAKTPQLRPDPAPAAAPQPQIQVQSL